MNTPLLLNSVWEIASYPQARSFARALSTPAGIQRELLLRLVRRNAGTAFGRRHHFPEVRSLEDYRERVPVRGYDGFLPWIDRIRVGEANVLTTEPVTRLVPTGGSSGGGKLIPWTAGLGREFRRALAPWVVDLFRQDPELKRGPAYWSVTPPASASDGTTVAGSMGSRLDASHESEPPSAVPIGFDGDSHYLGGVLGKVVRPILAVPEGRPPGEDPGEALQRTGQLLARCRELRLISVWHPSFLLLLLDRAGIRDPLESWPRLRLVSCWTDAGAAGSAEELRQRFPGVAVQGKGLLATEGVTSLPWGGRHPLAIRSHFVEFLDAEERALLAHEVEVGQVYEVVLSTAGGLYRYRTHDRVRITGRLGATPTLGFVGRGDRVVDLRGEKLTDAFVHGVLQQLFGRDPAVPFSLLAPSPDGSPAGYHLFVQAPPDRMSGVADRLDGLLSANPQYHLARRLGQLAPPVVVPVGPGASSAYLEARAAAGGQLGAIKLPALDPGRGWHRVLPPPEGSLDRTSIEGGRGP